VLHNWQPLPLLLLGSSTEVKHSGSSSGSSSSSSSRQWVSLDEFGRRVVDGFGVDRKTHAAACKVPAAGAAQAAV
jgi:hypothetical protein